MNFHLPRFVVFLLFLFASFNAHAQVPTDYRFHILNEEYGLTNGVINSIAQDTLGFTWVGTEDGLFRFDGQSFTSFRSGKNSNIPNNTINKVFVDSKNQVWILTNFGLAKYSYLTDSIESYLPETITETGRIKTLTNITETDSGELLIGTSGGGVIKFNKGEFSSFLEDFPELAVADIATLEKFEDDLWVATWAGDIYHFSLSKDSPELVSRYTPEKVLYVYDMALRNTDNSLLLGTSEGLWQIQPESQSISILHKAFEDEVLSLACSDQALWIGTRTSGLVKLSNENNEVLEHFMPGPGQSNVSNKTISAIHEDRTGNIWLGTHHNGVNVFNPAGELLSIIYPSESNDKYSSINVWGISNEDEEHVLLGTDGGGLYRFNLTNNQSNRIATTAGPIKITDDAILATLRDSKERIWLGTYSGGLELIVDGVAQSIGQNTLLSQDIRAISEDESGTIWIGTNRGGLYSFSEQSGDLIYHEPTGFLDIRGILTLPEYNGILWLITYGDGLVTYHKESSELKFFDWNAETNYTPIGLDAAAYDKRIWIGTKQNGLVIFDPESKTFEQIGESKGLLNNSVRAIVPFGNHIWMSTNIGISAYQINTNNISNFNTSDDFFSGQFNDGSALTLADQYIAFGNRKGLVFFDPKELLSPTSPPAIVISSLSVDEEKIEKAPTSGYLKHHIAVADALTLGPSNNNFSLNFGTLGYPDYDNWKYQYQLQGYDEGWINANSSHQATYGDLSPGNYVFRARIVDFNNQVMGDSRDLLVTILPPWYRTIYAYSAAVFLLIILLYLIYSYNYERANFKQSLIYEKKLRQQQEEIMQDKIRFYTNFSHEMRTPITLISGPTNDLINSESITEKDKKSLRLIKRNSNSLLKLINRLLEFRKIETENTVLNIGEYDLSILAQEEAESFSYASNERGIKFGFYSESSLKAWVDIEKVQIIMNNLLSNAMNYSKEGDKINFGVYQKDEYFVIEVKDEGRGIPKEELNKIFTPFYQAGNSLKTGGTGIGLALCKSLVDHHFGKIEVKSELGSGSNFKVLLKEGKAHFEGLPNVRFITPLQGEIQEIEKRSVKEEEELEVLENETVMLVVDDNRDIREYVSHQFSEKFKVIESNDGLDALEKAKDLVPDIIISDIMMPKMDGIAFCKAIKNNLSTSHIPVLLLTAKGGNQSKQEGYEVGADGYITKPFDSGVLKARVKNLLTNREKLRNLHENGHWLENKDVPSREVDFILKVEEAVLDLAGKGNLNVVELCKELGFSRTSLYRKIKSLTGQSIKQFIRSIKLKKAAEMLIAEDMSVSEVAFALDFTDLKYFRTCFKKQHGLLPSEYRNNHKADQEIDQEAIKKAINI